MCCHRDLPGGGGVLGLRNVKGGARRRPLNNKGTGSAALRSPPHEPPTTAGCRIDRDPYVEKGNYFLRENY